MKLRVAFILTLAATMVGRAWANCSTVSLVDPADCSEEGIEKLLFEVSEEVNEELCGRRNLRTSERSLFDCSICPWCEMNNHVICIAFCEASCYRKLSDTEKNRVSTPAKIEHDKERSLSTTPGDFLLPFGFDYVDNAFDKNALFDDFISRYPEMASLENCRGYPIYVLHNPDAVPPCCTRNFRDCYKGRCGNSEEDCGRCGKAEWMQPQRNCVPLNGSCLGNEDGCCQNTAGTVQCVGNVWNKKCRV